MLKLTDTHRTILAAAGTRDRYLILPLPKSLKLTAPKSEPILSALHKSELISEIPFADGDILWRTDAETGKLTLAATAAGLKAVGIDIPDQQLVDDTSGDRPTTRSTKKQTSGPAAGRTPKQEAKKTSVKNGSTKLATVIAALRLKKGATIADLMSTTGWQAHSVRGAISGALKKKLGLNVISTAVEGRGRVYRIAE